MTKQEKIREGVARWLFTFVQERESLKLYWEQTKGYYLQEADLLLTYEHSEGVVIKVERELPRLPASAFQNYSHDEVVNKCLLTQQDMLAAKFLAVEPLIKEVKYELET